MRGGVGRAVGRGVVQWGLDARAGAATLLSTWPYASAAGPSVRCASSWWASSSSSGVVALQKSCGGGVPSRGFASGTAHWTRVERETKVRAWKQMFRDYAFVTILQQSPVTQDEFDAWRNEVALAAAAKGGMAAVARDVRSAWLARAWSGTRWGPLAPGLSGTIVLVAGSSMDVLKPVTAVIEAKYGTFFVPVATVVRGSSAALTPAQVGQLGKLDADAEYGELVGLLEGPGRSIVAPLEDARGQALVGTLAQATAQPVTLLASIEQALKEKDEAPPPAAP